MQKLIFSMVLVVFIFMLNAVSAQNNYISHTLKQGESLSVLAKQYNTNVGDIMRMNGMHADTKMVYGSVIKIPSVKKNKIEETIVQPVKQDVVVKPINSARHTVVRGETLYSISKQYNVTTDQIKVWNNISDNSVKLGSSLIIGQNNSAQEINKPVADLKRQRVETTQPNTNNTIQPEQNTSITNNAMRDEKSDNTNVSMQNEIVNNQTASTTNNVETNIVLSQKGYFENQFGSKTKRKEHVSGISKTFKTASGWSDGKYYILADDINPGTIVKLTADNGKSVYAKVLWNMGDLKENNGINFRVSNATAAALNENATSFNLDIYY